MIRLPTDNDRISVLGATGSGKTYAGLWQLSRRNYTTMPWIIYDFKYDELINGIEGAETIQASDAPPTKPGIFIVHPHPDDTDLLEQQFMRIWENENTGIFVDEGMMIGNRNRWFRSLLTQGRSKHVPMIVLSQRPTWMDRFVFTESQFFQVFRLQDSEDVKNVQRFVKGDISKELPELHSYYYDVKANKMDVLKPVPDGHAILDTFKTRLRTIPKTI